MVNSALHHRKTEITLIYILIAQKINFLMKLMYSLSMLALDYENFQ